MSRTLRSLGAVLLLAVAVSASAADSGGAERPRTSEYDVLGRLVSVSATPREIQYDQIGRVLQLSAASATSTAYIAHDPVNYSDPDGV